MIFQKNVLFYLILFIMQFMYCNVSFADLFIYNSHERKDPFAPPVIASEEKSSAEALTGITLEGIIWDKYKPLAIINNKVMGVGSEISGAKIIEIKKNEVVFEANGKKTTIKLQSKAE